MIETREQYLQAMDALRDLEESMTALRAKLGPAREHLFRAMAQDYLDSIAVIREEIDQYTGATAAALVRAPLWMGLVGADLSPRNIKTSLLATWLERMRKSMAALVDHGLTGRERRGRYPQAVLDSCDFRLVGFQAGSLKVGLDVAPPRQRRLFDEAEAEPEELVQEALQRLVAAAGKIEEAHRTHQTSELWPEGFPEEDRLLYRQVLRVIPGRRERVAALVLEGSFVPRAKPIYLDASIRSTLVALLSSDHDLTEVEELEGRLREIDLDRRRFILRERPDQEPDVPVYFRENQYSEAKSALDQRVRVQAARTPGQQQRLRAILIEVLEDSPL